MARRVPKVRVGLVGLGGMGRCHLGAWCSLPGAQVVAVCDVEKVRLRTGPRAPGTNIRAGGRSPKLGGVRKYLRAEELISNPEVEVVDVCLPSDLHERCSIMALEAGKHVLCEKPISVSLAAARRMSAAARRSPGSLMVAHCIRFWPEYAWAREEVFRRRRYGRVLAASFRRLSAPPRWSWRDWLLDESRSGGVPLDLHIHDVDFLRCALGKPRAVSAAASTGTVKRGVTDHILAHYRYEGTGPVTAEASWCMAPSFGFEMSFTIVCEKATVLYSSRTEPTMVIHTRSGRSLTPRLPAGDGYRREIEYFLDCVARKRSPRLSGAEEALKSLELALAEVRSLRARGRWVKV